jgi:hypothetical protein
MSTVPAAIAGSVSGATAVMNPIDIIFAGINTSPYFIGLMMLLLNLGGRFLALEISKDQEKFLSQPYIRRFFLFAVLFVATRNVIIAACLAIVVILLLGYLFNENSELCLWKSCAEPAAAPVSEGFTGLTSEEAMILKRLQDKQAQATAQAEPQETPAPVKLPPLASQVYQSSLQRIQALF